uniref:Uncharacterized protein n=1 Tax=Gasterosteus aculeatus TaxID=69293 RepID=G3NLC2_GASAC
MVHTFLPEVSTHAAAVSLVSLRRRWRLLSWCAVTPWGHTELLHHRVEENRQTSQICLNGLNVRKHNCWSTKHQYEDSITSTG